VGSAIDANLLESLIEIHRDLGANPREFFSAIDLFKQILEQKLAKTKHLTAHLFSGVEKIKAANQLVDQLSENASRQKRELRVKQEEAEKFLVKIQQTYESASDQKREAEEIREYLKKEEEKTLDKRQAIEEELAKVNPIVEEAKKQVRSINKGHIAELKSMANPPSQVDDVFQALFKVNGEGDVSWSYMKKALTNDSFFKQILAIDARSTLLLTSHHAQAPARGLRLRQEKPWLFREGRHLQGLAGRGPNRGLRAGAAEAGRDLRENQALRRPAQGTLG
jgi:dynein heavy chain 1